MNPGFGEWKNHLQIYYPCWATVGEILEVEAHLEMCPRIQLIMTNQPHRIPELHQIKATSNRVEAEVPSTNNPSILHIVPSTLFKTSTGYKAKIMTIKLSTSGALKSQT